MNYRALAFTFAAAMAAAAPAFSQQIVLLPPGSSAYDVTPDGSIVVGLYPGGTWPGNGFIWRWKQDAAPTVVTGGYFRAVSDDGSVVAGNTVDPFTGEEVAAIWTQAGGWQTLGVIPLGGSCGSQSSAYDISGDGTTVVGLGWNACSGRGFRWTAATGMQELQNLVNGQNRCSAISRDGSTLGGFGDGTFQRTPAYWAPNTTGFVLDPNFQGEVCGFTNNGGLSVGTNYFAGSNLTAFVRNKQTGVMTNLGSVNAGWNSEAIDISENGKVIVGYDTLMLAQQAWLWTAYDGMKSLNSRLAALGMTGVPALHNCMAVSDDGTVIVGTADSGTTAWGRGYIVRLPSLEPYGTGTPGCTGTPALSANSLPFLGSPTFALTSTNAPASSLGVWLIGSAADVAGSDPFNLGVKFHVNLFTSAELLSLNGTSDATGLGTCASPIPNNAFFAGRTYYAQVLWYWPAFVCTSNYLFSSSNGLAITVLP